MRLNSLTARNVPPREMSNGSVGRFQTPSLAQRFLLFSGKSQEHTGIIRNGANSCTWKLTLSQNSPLISKSHERSQCTHAFGPAARKCQHSRQYQTLKLLEDWEHRKVNRSHALPFCALLLSRYWRPTILVAMWLARDLRWPRLAFTKSIADQISFTYGLLTSTLGFWQRRCLNVLHVVCILRGARKLWNWKCVEHLTCCANWRESA